jgi:hypothetical protein
MLQNSKIIKSRNEWKEKATLRATENQNYRKTIGRNKETILQLKKEIAKLNNLKKNSNK